MSGNWQPAYLQLGIEELQCRAEEALRHLESCDLCARGCHINRRLGTEGFCRTGPKLRVYSHGPHFGEERPLVGCRGSGTIFFSRCNLKCVFCQNWEISHRGEGCLVGPEELAAMMLALQGAGCHNINLVSPSHVVAQILGALPLAVEQGLKIPIAYNSGGYDSLAALQLLDGIVDIYLPDMKFADSRKAAPWLGVNDYAEVNRAALAEMYRQVGVLQCGPTGIARRGLLIRHLILPDNAAGTDELLRFVAGELSPDVHINLMDQYRPCYRADQYPPLDRRPTRAELCQARQWAKELGMRNLLG
ncbi:putative pyruvate formate lyase activating enzyme [Geothermobacter ehrlichii]|uniref:Putative pyruvate formate lyase activating enzyme n=1 Tax=Geothermobacter ehrlichii TaxID=213224 RepID=A0A5D3WJL1_9BACT|nr:radical SAM protein [Geothermobacter ehrlichii]TYO99165.1 putative pyruvate formate lyase activating enzyme [Geothermobacter ehrlichii]